MKRVFTILTSKPVVSDRLRRSLRRASFKKKKQSEKYISTKKREKSLSAERRPWRWQVEKTKKIKKNNQTDELKMLIFGYRNLLVAF